MSDLSEYGRLKQSIKEHHGCQFGRLIQTMAVGQGDTNKSIQYAKGLVGSAWIVAHLEKSAVAPGTTGDATFAAPLGLPTPVASELTFLLYPTDVLTKLLQLGARSWPFNVRVPKFDVGATSSWAAAGGPVPVSASALSTIALGIYKTSAMQVLTTELARSQFLDVSQSLAVDMAQSLARFRNVAALNPDNAGLLDTSPASLTYGATQVQSTGITIAQFTNDAAVAMNTLIGNGVPLADCVWVMSEKLGAFLSRLRTTTGAAAFPGISALGGEWFGLPVLTSGAEVESASPTESFFSLLSVGSVAIAQDPVPVIDSSQATTVQMLDNPIVGATSTQSLFQLGLVGVRASIYCNWVMRRAIGISTIRGINGI